MACHGTLDLKTCMECAVLRDGVLDSILENFQEKPQKKV